MLDCGVLTDLIEHLLELFLIEEVGGTAFNWCFVVHEVDQRLRNKDLPDLLENRHLVAQFAGGLLEHKHALLTVFEVVGGHLE